jgi:hypothetical protein
MESCAELLSLDPCDMRVEVPCVRRRLSVEELGIECYGKADVIKAIEAMFAARAGSIKSPYDACVSLWEICNAQEDLHSITYEDDSVRSLTDNPLLFSKLAAQLWKAVCGRWDEHLAAQFVTATWSSEREKRRTEGAQSLDRPTLRVLAGLPRPALLEVLQQLYAPRR